MKNDANASCSSTAFKCLMNIICIWIASSAKKRCIIVHLFSLSAREFTEFFQVPKNTTSRLALLTHLNESEMNSGMQTRAMPIVGITCSLLCFDGIRAAANILLHVKKEKKIYLRTYHISLRGTHLTTVQQNIVALVF